MPKCDKMVPEIGIFALLLERNEVKVSSEKVPQESQNIDI